MRILSESGIASGVRRIEAVTGASAIAAFDLAEQRLSAISGLLKSNPDNALAKVEAVLASNRKLEKDLAALKAKLASGAGNDLMSKVEEVSGVRLLTALVDGADSKSLRGSLDQLKNKIGSGVLLLAAVEGDKVSLVAGVSKDLLEKFKAGELMRLAASEVGGKGGGRPDMAQGGGTQPENLEAAFAAARKYVSA